jgi:hypothetical protein
MKNERHSLSPLEGPDLSEDDPVVTARLHSADPAVQATQRTRHLRRLRIGTPIKVDVELLVTAAGEMQGKIALVVAKHMNRERRSRSECRKARALIGETPQYQRRVERDGREGIRGRPHRLAIGANGSHHCHASGECAEDISELTMAQPSFHSATALTYITLAG